MHGDRCFVLWHAVAKWGSLIHTWAVDKGLTGTVLTLFEIHSGDETTDQPFNTMGTPDFYYRFVEGSGQPNWQLQLRPPTELVSQQIFRKKLSIPEIKFNVKLLRTSNYHKSVMNNDNIFKFYWHVVVTGGSNIWPIMYTAYTRTLSIWDFWKLSTVPTPTPALQPWIEN